MWRATVASPEYCSAVPMPAPESYRSHKCGRFWIPRLASGEPPIPRAQHRRRFRPPANDARALCRVPRAVTAHSDHGLLSSARARQHQPDALYESANTQGCLCTRVRHRLQGLTLARDAGEGQGRRAACCKRVYQRAWWSKSLLDRKCCRCYLLHTVYLMQLCFPTPTQRVHNRYARLAFFIRLPQSTQHHAAPYP